MFFEERICKYEKKFNRYCRINSCNVSCGGCGKKTENTNTTPQQTAQADASGAYENGSATETLDGQDYSKNVDMAAVEGTEAKSDTKADSYSGE